MVVVLPTEAWPAGPWSLLEHWTFDAWNLVGEGKWPATVEPHNTKHFDSYNIFNSTAHNRKYFAFDCPNSKDMACDGLKSKTNCLPVLGVAVEGTCQVLENFEGRTGCSSQRTCMLCWNRMHFNGLDPSPFAFDCLRARIFCIRPSHVQNLLPSIVHGGVL